MPEYVSLLQGVSLFEGMQAGEITDLLGCLCPRREFYPKKAILLIEGQSITEVGIVLSGRVQVIKEDFMGNRHIVGEMGAGQPFAESFSFAQTGTLPVTVISAADSDVIWIGYRRIIGPCANSCQYHMRLIENMLSILAEKNVLLTQKIDHISRRTTREKLLTYLSDQAIVRGRRDFTIPFDRQELADYLCVDRSAMSGELSKLRDEGILWFDRSRFRLLVDTKEPEGEGARI